MEFQLLNYSELNFYRVKFVECRRKFLHTLDYFTIKLELISSKLNNLPMKQDENFVKIPEKLQNSEKKKLLKGWENFQLTLH